MRSAENIDCNQEKIIKYQHSEHVQNQHMKHCHCRSQEVISSSFCVSSRLAWHFFQHTRALGILSVNTILQTGHQISLIRPGWAWYSHISRLSCNVFGLYFSLTYLWWIGSLLGPVSAGESNTFLHMKWKRNWQIHQLHRRLALSYGQQRLAGGKMSEDKNW